MPAVELRNQYKFVDSARQAAGAALDASETATDGHDSVAVDGAQLLSYSFLYHIEMCAGALP